MKKKYFSTGIVWRIIIVSSTLSLIFTACQETAPMESHKSVLQVSNSISADASSASTSLQADLPKESRAYDMQLDPLIKKEKPQTQEDWAEYYLSLANLSSMLHGTWEDADALSPNSMLAFYSLHILVPKHPYGWFSLELPAEEVDPEIQLYFDVSAKQLHMATAFQTMMRSYSFSYGIGSASWASMDQCIIQEKRCVINYTMHNTLDEVVGTGQLVLELSPDGTCRFISCQYTASHSQ